jgi:hypothetical protein
MTGDLFDQLSKLAIDPATFTRLTCRRVSASDANIRHGADA